MMSFFKVWEWPQQAASFAVLVLLVGFAGWYLDRRLAAHYTSQVRADVAEEVREARVIQSKANAAAVNSFKASMSRASKGLDQKLIEVARYDKTLPANTACLADAEFVRLFNNGRTR